MTNKIAAFAIAALLSLSSTQAAEVPFPQGIRGAPAVQAAIQTGIEKWAISLGPDYRLVWKDEVTVEPVEGGAFDISLPPFSLYLPSGLEAQAPSIHVLSRPEGVNRWRITVNLPGRIPLLGANGKEQGQLTVASSVLDGLWASDLQMFLEQNLKAADVMLALSSINRYAALHVLSSKSFTPAANGLYDGKSHVEIAGITHVDGHDTVLNLKDVSWDSTFSGVNLKTLAHMQEEFQSGDFPAEMPARRHARSILFRSGVPLAAFRSTGRLNGLDLEEDGFHFILPAATFSAEGKSLNTSAGMLSVGAQYNNLSVDPSPAAPDFIPRSLNLKLALQSLPGPALWKALIDQISNRARYGAGAANAMLTNRLPAILGAGGTRTRIESLTASMPALAVSLAGTLAFAPKPPHDLRPALTLKVQGLPALVKSLVSNASSTQAPAEPGSANSFAAPILALVQMAGKPDKRSKDMLVYDIKTSEDGSITLNGVPFAALLDALPEGEKTPARSDILKKPGAD